MSLADAWRWYQENKEHFYASTVSTPSAQSGRWIQGAIKNPGRLREDARRAGAITARGTINKNWIRKAATQKGNPALAKRARLAMTLDRVRPR